MSFRLKIRQEPVQGRLSGFTRTQERRCIEPALILQALYHDTDGRIYTMEKRKEWSQLVCRVSLFLEDGQSSASMMVNTNRLRQTTPVQELAPPLPITPRQCEPSPVVQEAAKKGSRARELVAGDETSENEKNVTSHVFQEPDSVPASNRLPSFSSDVVAAQEQPVRKRSSSSSISATSSESGEHTAHRRTNYPQSITTIFTSDSGDHNGHGSQSRKSSYDGTKTAPSGSITPTTTVISLAHMATIPQNEVFDSLVGDTYVAGEMYPDLDGSDAMFFVFGDLGVRSRGKYRLKCQLLHVHPTSKEARILHEVTTSVFAILSPKLYRGESEFSQLSRWLSEKGAKIPFRRSRGRQKGAVVNSSSAQNDTVANADTDTNTISGFLLSGGGTGRGRRATKNS